MNNTTTLETKRAKAAPVINYIYNAFERGLAVAMFDKRGGKDEFMLLDNEIEILMYAPAGYLAATGHMTDFENFELFASQAVNLGFRLSVADEPASELWRAVRDANLLDIIPDEPELEPAGWDAGTAADIYYESRRDNALCN